MTHDRRTFLKTLGVSGIGLASTPLYAGSAAAATIITMEGGGYDIWSDHDEFHFYYAEVSGDFDVTVYNPFVEDTSQFAKGGIMARETLANDAKNVMLRHIPSGLAALQWRPAAGDETLSTTSGGEDVAEVDGGHIEADWLRLKRSGDTFEAFASTDEGSSWTRIGALDASNVSLSDTLYVGLPATSHNSGTLATVEYSSLSGLSPTANGDVGDVDVAGSVDVATGVPIVTAGDATDVTAVSATLHGTLEDLGEASSAECYFEYHEVDADSWSDSAATTRTSLGTFEQELTDLAPQERYEFRAVADTSDGDAATSAVGAFETPSIVRMDSVEDVTADSATFHGGADLLGFDAAEVFFQYRELNTESWSETERQTVTESGAFSADVSGLTSRRYFEVRAALTAEGVDTVTSETLDFGTPSSAAGDSDANGPDTVSQFGIDDGWASADWLSDDTPVVVVREATREQLARALHVDGERLVVFETSGTIDLEGGIGIHNDRFYVAGQTAPSPGITLEEGGVFVEAEDFVIQHVRVRRGDDTPSSGAGDAMGTSEHPKNGIFDHVTATWGSDETLSCYGTDMTISNSIVAEGLRNSDFHQGGNGHSAGSLIGSGYERIAMMGNLWASNLTRNPRLQSGTSVVVNNVGYDFRNAAPCSPETVSSFVGNTYVRGDVDTPILQMYGDHEGEIFVHDNVTRPDAQAIASDEVIQTGERPVWPSGLEALSVEEGEQHVYQNAGARPADRTYHDRRIVRNAVNWEVIGDNLPGGSGLDHAWIDHEEIIGDYPELPENTRSLEVPQSGTWGWLGAHARRVEVHPEDDYEYADGPGVVDDFEDGDVEEWVGATGNYEVNADAPVASGDYSLKNVTGGDGVVASFTDLPRYPQAGDTVSAKVAPTEETGVVGIAFGIKSFENFYFVRYWPGSSALQLYKVYDDEWSDPSYEKLAQSGTFSLETGEIYEYVLDWGTDGAIDIELRDADGNALGSLSATDSTHLYGGFGTRRTGMLDDVRIL